MPKAGRRAEKLREVLTKILGHSSSILQWPCKGWGQSPQEERDAPRCRKPGMSTESKENTPKAQNAGTQAVNRKSISLVWKAGGWPCKAQRDLKSLAGPQIPSPLKQSLKPTFTMCEVSSELNLMKDSNSARVQNQLSYVLDWLGPTSSAWQRSMSFSGGKCCSVQPSTMFSTKFKNHKIHKEVRTWGPYLKRGAVHRSKYENSPDVWIITQGTSKSW